MRSLFRLDLKEANAINSIALQTLESDLGKAEAGLGFTRAQVDVCVVHGRQDISALLIWSITISHRLRQVGALLSIICLLLGYIAYKL